jgi:hypothetical protein
MKLRCLVTALALLAAFASHSWGQSKQPAQVKQAAQPTATDQRGTEQSPAIIKIIPSPKSVEETEVDRREREEKNKSDWWLIKLTAALAIVGALQLLVFGYQAIQLKRTVEATKQAAEHIPRVERAYVFVTVNGDDMRIPIMAAYAAANSETAHLEITHPISVEFSFENQGKTPAEIREVSASLVHWTELPLEPNYDASARLALLPTNRYLAANSRTAQKPVELQIRPTFSAAMSMMRGDSFIWFYGRVIYFDIFGEEHEHRFVWRFGSGDFNPYYGNKSYITST